VTRELLGRGWSFPFRFDPSTGGVATSGGEETIRESMTIILGTRPGERQMLPDFGCRIHELMFAPGTAANAALITWHVKQALQKWEPRVDVIGVESLVEGGGKVRVQVRYRVKTTQAEQVLDLDLNPGG
jgi:phage baseplate assembly protein W